MSQAIQNLKLIVEQQLSIADKFADKEFPPESSVVLGPKYSKYYLHRATDLYKNPRIISSEISPTEIEQGRLRNNYFLSAVATLAEDPSAIRRLFLTEEPNKTGMYALWLCDNGTWRPVLVDDYIPCNKQSGSYFPIFAQTAHEDLWISLLEKAYAKIYGSYSNIEKGSCQNALRDLTGAPVEELRNANDIEKVWNFINEAIDKQYFLCCSDEVAEEDGEEETQAVEQPETHIYTILDAREVQTAKGAERLVLLRDPFNSSQWQGAWSNNSQEWTEELRNELKYHEEDAQQGLFWMSLEDYEQHIPSTWICKYRPTNKYSSLNLDSQINNHYVFRIHVKDEQEVTFSINQKDERCFQDKEGYKYSYARLLLGKVFGEGLGYIGGNSGAQRNLHVTAVLKPGTYILTSEVYWNQEYHKNFNISFYSEGDLEVEGVPGADILLMQKSIILSSIENLEESRRIKPYDKYGDANIQRIEGRLHGLIYFYYVNLTTKDSKLIEKINFASMSGLQICPPFTNPNHVEVTVFPDHEVLVLYKVTEANPFSSNTTSFKIQPVSDHEIPENVPQEIYDYIDDPNKAEPLELNEDQDYILEGLDLEFGENDAHEDRDNLNERRLTDSWIYSSPETYKSSPSKKNSTPVKSYPALEMESGQTNSKKIPYINHDDYDKELKIVTSDPKIVHVKNPQITVKAGETAIIRLRFQAPMKPGVYETAVEVKGNKRLQETLYFTINNRDEF